MELVRYWRALRRRWKLVLVCPLLAAVAAGVLSVYLPPVYEARVAILVRPAQPLAVTDATSVILTADEIGRTYATLMTEPPLLNEVSDELHLQAQPTDLAKRISVTPRPNTTILDVSVQDNKPRRARDIANRLVQDFLAQVKAIQSQEAATPNARSADNLVVVSAAVTPEQPTSPSIPRNVALAIVAGSMLGIGVAVAREYFDHSIKGADDLSERSGLPVIGHILYKAPEKTKLGELVTLAQDSPAAEGYKVLRTNLLFSAVDRNLKTLVITSANAGEGKSRTAANLAIVLAEAGHTTLLVDADFRNPTQHRLFGRIRNVGLSNLIIQDATELEVIADTQIMSHLSLLTTGPAPPNPSELLGSSRARELFASLARDFAYVVVDAPPVNAVTDASVLAAGAGATVLVVEDQKTTYPALQRAQRSLDRVGAHTLGVVLNKIHPSGVDAYGYGYGYGLR
jgi:polysaccharide biosynthesis transport protein